MHKLFHVVDVHLEFVYGQSLAHLVGFVLIRHELAWFYKRRPEVLQLLRHEDDVNILLFVSLVCYFLTTLGGFLLFLISKVFVAINAVCF